MRWKLVPFFYPAIKNTKRLFNFSALIKYRGIN